MTAPPQVGLLGHPPLIVEFYQTEDCAFKCSMRVCVCLCVLHCFLQYKRDGGMLPHARHAMLKPIPLPPCLGHFVLFLMRDWHAQRFLCARNSLAGCLSHTSGGEWGKKRFQTGHVVSTPLYVAR